MSTEYVPFRIEMLAVNLAELKNLASKGESETLELKRSTGQLRAAMKTVCAMLNGIGGFVIFGVNDHRQLVGQDVSTKTHEEIANELRKIEPPAFPDIETVMLENGRAVVVLRVSGGSGLFSYDHRPYHRVGPTTSTMPRQRYERLLLEKMHASHRWENQPAAAGLNMADLDAGEIIRTVEEAIRRGRMDDPGTRNVDDLLLGLGLIHGGQLLNAAVVLFGRGDHLLPQYPQCILRMARFRGIDKTAFADNRQEVGNAFDLLLRAQRFFRDHLPIAGRLVPGVFERVDDPLYPPEALREAIANALCHRDYAVGGGAVSIAIYDNRLEITSTGQLPFGLTPEDLARPHQSRPWNPLIAQVFYRRGIIESWGRGTLKMAELTERAGLAPPEFESGRGEVLVRFWPTRYVPPMRISHDLNALQRELLDIIAQGGPISLKFIRQDLSLSVPERTIQDNLQLLRQLKLIDVTGRGPGARWALRSTQTDA